MGWKQHSQLQKQFCDGVQRQGGWSTVYRRMAIQNPQKHNAGCGGTCELTNLIGTLNRLIERVVPVEERGRATDVDRWLNANGAAAILGMSRAALHARCREGQIRYKTVNRRKDRRFLRSYLDEFDLDETRKLGGDQVCKQIKRQTSRYKKEDHQEGGDNTKDRGAKRNRAEIKTSRDFSEEIKEIWR